MLVGLSAPVLPCERLAGHHGVGMGLIAPSLAALDGRPHLVRRTAVARRPWSVAALPAIPTGGPWRDDG